MPNRSKPPLAWRLKDAFGGRLVKMLVDGWGRRSPWPRQECVPLRGLSQRVRVLRDNYGVAHIRASTDGDAMRAQGYCHALDRYLQMDLLRRVLRGRLAATIGDRQVALPFARGGSSVDSDRFMQSIGLAASATSSFYVLGEDAQGLLRAYAEGVNAAGGQLARVPSPSMRLLRIRFKPWTPEDCLLIGKAMALMLSFKWRTAQVFHGIEERLRGDSKRLRELLPRAEDFGDEAMLRLETWARSDGPIYLPRHAPMRGSNAFMVGAARSASGAPILANDPHLDLSLPSIWYLGSVHGRTYRAVGASIPGVPGIVLGRSEHVAWGVTNAMVDDADLWIEELDAAGTHYRLDDRWMRLRVETMRIERKGRGPLIYRQRYTHRGPLLSDAYGHTQAPHYSIRFAMSEPSRDVEAFLRLGRARSVDAVKQAFLDYGSPAQNFLVADAQGKAHYMLVGRVPKRAMEGAGAPAHPALPRDGTTRASDWTGYVAPRVLPAWDVASGDICVSANQPHIGSQPHGANQPHSASQPHSAHKAAAHRPAAYISHLYEPAYRSWRILERLESQATHNQESLASIQMDCQSLAVRRFRSAILLPLAPVVRARVPALAPTLDRLIAWDGLETSSSTEAALWHFTYHHLVRRTFGARLGTYALERWMGSINLVDAALFRAFASNNSAWVPVDVRATLFAEALNDARAALVASFGTTRVRWGEVHELTLHHPASSTPWTRRAYARGPYEVAGGPFSVCSGQYSHIRPARVYGGASLRFVVDLAQPEHGRMIMPGGQSERPGSRHYNDMTARWLINDGIAMRLRDEPEEGSAWTLTPS